MMLSDSDGLVARVAQFQGGPEPALRNHCDKLLSRKLRGDELDRRDEIGIRGEQQRLVENVLVRELEKLDCEVDIAFLLLMRDPRRLALLTMPVFLLEVAEYNVNACALQGLHIGEVSLVRRRQSGREGREVP